MSEELLQNVTDILENAHSQRIQLTDLLSSLEESKNQVKKSAEESRCNIMDHFSKLKKAVIAALDARMDTLIKNVDNIEEAALSPLCQCEDMINQGIMAATRVMEDGKKIIKIDPKDNVEELVKFRDNTDSRHLDSLPEVPSLYDVPYISLELTKGLDDKLSELINEEGKILERAPVQITDIEEGPGSLTIRWSEVDDDIEVCDFRLQFCSGSVNSNQTKCIFHNAYTGPLTSYRLTQLRTNAPYSFRVCHRSDSCGEWSTWSIPRVAMTTIPHYQWCISNEGYSTSNDDRILTRLDCEDTFIHYSKEAVYTTGHPIKFKIIDAGEGSPMDGIGLAIDNTDVFTFQRNNAIFINSSGAVFVDGNEMKTRLPPSVKGCADHISY
ncbi:hypothetical protein KUTeg_003464 [Tegillarca granosa]|uniref:Fibronectin type-III domain-containing protein n=1 Tax=Tegillarca granosa TaxID=220873 RepID=A0ABQ9FRR5_TEGGR|nr:hypothetical protein KUTeg_003464 [Tegillarca granosa]